MASRSYPRSIAHARTSVPVHPVRLERVLIGSIFVVVLLPIVPLVVFSFSGRWLFPALVPTEWSLRAWESVATPRSRVLGAVSTSAVIALSVTALCIVLGVPAGRGLAALSPRLRAAMRFLFFAPLVMPALAVALGLHVLFVRAGLADSIGGVVVAHLLPSLPYMVLVMESSFSHSEFDLEAQARTLGAGPVRAFLLVGLPTALPGLLTGALFVFLISWSQYALTLLIGGGRVMTLPLMLFAFASSGDTPITAALSVVFLVPAMLVLGLTARFLTGRPVALTGVAGR